ncbi:MAG: UvrB/UvrC motif-containing protein [Limisphaerales bacterium]
MFCKQNPAKVHLTQIIGDKMQKVDLCEDCAKQKGVNDPAGFSLADLLLGLGASQEIAQTSGGEEVKCLNCGFTQADFKKAGRLGCSQCYSTFAEGLESLLKSMHKGTKHVGKVPLALRQGRDLTERLRYLQKKLDRAVTSEDFEQAATLRDEIKETKDQMNQVVQK